MVVVVVVAMGMETGDREQRRKERLGDIPVEFIVKVFAGCPRIRTKSGDLARRQ